MSISWDQLSKDTVSQLRGGFRGTRGTLFAYQPSGKRLHNYGKSWFLMGKSTISMAIFNSYVCLPEGVFFSVDRQCSWHAPRPEFLTARFKCILLPQCTEETLGRQMFSQFPKDLDCFPQVCYTVLILVWHLHHRVHSLGCSENILPVHFPLLLVFSIFCPRPSPKKWDNDPLLLQDVSAIRGSTKQVFGLRESLPNTCVKNGSSHWFISHSGVTLFNLSGNLSGIDKIW